MKDVDQKIARISERSKQAVTGTALSEKDVQDVI